jgi:hypothetical protein
VSRYSRDVRDIVRSDLLVGVTASARFYTSAEN